MAQNRPISYGRQSLDSLDIKAVVDVLESDYLTCGPNVEKFEQALCKVTGAKFAIACCNGTAALHLACLGLDLKKDSWGLTSPITFLASANCFEYVGLNADFADIETERLCLSPAAIEEYCKNVRVPSVVVTVDFAGVPSYLPEIHELAKKYGFRVIQDAAHSIGSAYQHGIHQVSCGACIHSDAAILSFHPVKTITTAEGGAVLTNDSKIADRVRLFRSHGMVKNAENTRGRPWYYEMFEVGFNFRITDMQCALGVSQLRHLDAFKRRRQEIVDRYNSAFKSVSSLIVPPAPAGTSPCYHLYTIQFVGGEAVRLAVYEELKKKGILCQVHYVPVHLQPYYKNKYGYAAGRCANAELYYSRCLSLPLYPSLGDDDVDEVIGTVLEMV